MGADVVGLLVVRGVGGHNAIIGIQAGQNFVSAWEIRLDVLRIKHDEVFRIMEIDARDDDISDQFLVREDETQNELGVAR